MRHKKIFLLVFLFVLATFNIFSTKTTFAIEPDPRPCTDPQPANNYLTDNYVTDAEGDPPGPQGAEDIEALKFTYIVNEPIGSIPNLTKTMRFQADFSKLQAIFASQNSNYLESTSISEDHAQANLIEMDPTERSRYQGPAQKTTPKVVTDALKQKYVEYVNSNPQLQEADLRFTDVNGQEDKNIHELVEEFGPPQPPVGTQSKTTWLETWGKYWEKIPTQHNEFYIGKLEFRPVHGTSAIAALKRGDDGACFPNPSIRTVEFPVPSFFRTSALSGQLNEVLVPKAAQSPGNLLEDIKGNILGAKTSVQNFIFNCFKFASDNPVTNAIKKGLEITLQKADPVKNVYAAGCDIDGSDVLPGASKRVTHEGFASGEDIFLFGEGASLDRGNTVDSLGGQRSQNITIPTSVTPGFYRIFIRTRYPVVNFWCVGDFNVLAPAPTPTPVAATCSYTGPNPATAGSSQISITHRGFAAGETIRIADNAFGTTRDFGTTTDSLGASRTQGPFTIPSGISGLWTVQIATRYPAVNFNCGGITINAPAASPSPATASCSGPTPTTVAPGGTINITHRGFASGETVRIVDKAFGSYRDIGTTRVSTGGSITDGPFTIPSGIGGLYEVRVVTRYPVIDFVCGDITISAPATPTCSYVSAATPPVPGTQLNITHQGFADLETIRIVDRLGAVNIFNMGTTTDSRGGPQTQTVIIPSVTIPGGYSVLITTRFPIINFDCGPIDIATPPPAFTLSLVEDPTTRPGDLLTFNISPAVTAADNVGLYVYLWDEGADIALDCRPLTGGSQDPCLDTGFLSPGGRVTWTPLTHGTMRAIMLNQWLGEASNELIFDVPFILRPPQVSGRTVTFNWDPGSDGNIALIVRPRDNPTATAFDSGSIYGGGPIPYGIKTLQWFRAPPGQYEVALLNRFLATITPWIPFDVSFTYEWTVFPLEADSCIKVHEGDAKQGNAPYCAIYPQKFENPGEPNILPVDSCQNRSDGFRLNPETSVICTFEFTWRSTDYNGTDKELVIPATGNGNWDTCDPPQGSVRTCYLTVGVWPDFRIPFLGQIWNNALYSDDKEYLQMQQDPGRPGVYSFFRPKGTDYDPLAARVAACDVDVDPQSQACDDLLQWGSENASRYPGITECTNTNLRFDIDPDVTRRNLVDCFRGVANLVTKKTPGEVQSNVQGAKTGGQVLAAHDGNQDERFIGSVDCEKHWARDVSLKPKVLQDHLGVTLECDLTASPIPTVVPNASPGVGPSPSPDSRTGSGCDGGNAFASLLPAPIPTSVNAQSPAILGRVNAQLLDAARYGQTRSATLCEVLIGLHYVEASWDASRSFVSGRRIGDIEPDVPSASACTAYGGTWSGGCIFSSLTDTAYYAGDHIKDKMSALGYGWRPPANFTELIGAMSYYNGGGNSNCGEGVPYTSPCPPPIGIDDPYAVSHFDAQHAQMYLIFCADYTRCSPPQAFGRDGAATAAKEFYLSR